MTGPCPEISTQEAILRNQYDQLAIALGDVGHASMTCAQDEPGKEACCRAVQRLNVIWPKIKAAAEALHERCGCDD